MGEEHRDDSYYMNPNSFHSMRVRMKTLADMCRDDEF